MNLNMSASLSVKTKKALSPPGGSGLKIDEPDAVRVEHLVSLCLLWGSGLKIPWYSHPAWFKKSPSTLEGVDWNGGSAAQWSYPFVSLRMEGVDWNKLHGHYKIDIVCLPPLGGADWNSHVFSYLAFIWVSLHSEGVDWNEADRKRRNTCTVSLHSEGVDWNRQPLKSVSSA